MANPRQMKTNPISRSQERTPWKISHLFRMDRQSAGGAAGSILPVARLIGTFTMTVETSAAIKDAAPSHRQMAGPP
jgi:hypothetical protein